MVAFTLIVACNLWQTSTEKCQQNPKIVSYWDILTTGYRKVMKLNQMASLGNCDYVEMFKILD